MILEIKSRVLGMSNFLELSPPIFNKLFNNILDPISVLENGVFVECNHATLVMLGMESKEELIGKTPWDISPEVQADGESSKQKAAKMIRKCVDEGSNRFEWIHTRPDGSTFTAEITLTFIPEMDVETVFVTWRDVTNQAKSLETIQEIQAQYEIITENAPTVILIHREGRWIYANKAVEEIFGLKPEEIIGEDIFKYAHPAQRQQLMDNAAKRLIGEVVPDRYDMCVIPPDGKEKWLDTKISVITFEGVPAVMINGLDITKKVEAERKLRESRERYKITLNSIGDAVISTDKDGHIQMMNPVAEKLTGWKQSEAKGEALEKVFAIFNAFTGENVQNPVEKVLKNGEIVGLANHTVLKSRDGKEHQIADSGAPIKDEFGNVLGVVLVFRDVTEQYIIEEQLKKTQKIEAVGQLASGLAHDFNNMLSGIIGSAEIVEDFLKSNLEEAAFASRIKEAAMNANELTKQLLGFSRKAGRERTEIKIIELIENTVRFISSSMGKNIEINIVNNAGEVVITGNKTQLQNTLINLFFNARDAMREGGTIECRISEFTAVDHIVGKLMLKSGNYIKIAVKDSGEGITTETLERIFEPYFTTKPSGKGTGLGLVMVQKAVDDHHGAVNVISQPGKGSTFEIYLPAQNCG